MTNIDQPFLWKRAKGWFFDQDASMMFTKSVNITGQSDESSAENGRSASLITGQRKRERSKIRGVTSCSHWKMLEIKANLDLKCVCELHLKWFLIIESIDHWNMRKSHPSIKKINIFTFQPAGQLSVATCHQGTRNSIQRCSECKNQRMASRECFIDDSRSGALGLLNFGQKNPRTHGTWMKYGWN